MRICQYEFQFENEFMEVIEKRVGDLLDISLAQEKIVKFGEGKQTIIFQSKNSENFMLFYMNQVSYMYLLIVRCEKKYEEKLKSILLEVCDEIDDEYDEDHRWEVKDVLGDSHNNFSKLEEKYKIKELFGI